METIATDLRELSLDNEELSLSRHTVMSNDDLLTEILIKVPAISLVLFKSVSKRWLSLIKDPAFIKRRNRIPNIDPPSAFFIRYPTQCNVGTYSSVSFDIRIPSRRENLFKNVLPSTNILQSCNGLFLCYVMPGRRLCVYNPTLNLFKMLPDPLDYEPKRYEYNIRMDFNPTKSPHYKVMYATSVGHFHEGLYQIQTYSSETGVWSIVCDCTDPYSSCDFGVYLNDAIHWLGGDNQHYYKLDVGNKNVVLTKIKLPISSVGNSFSLYESRGCLLLIRKDKKTHLMNVYEMKNGHSEWSMKYSVDYSRFLLGDGFPCMCITLGEREEDSFMFLGGYGCRNVYLYNFVLKTFRELTEFRSIPKENAFFVSYLFTASFASV